MESRKKKKPLEERLLKIMVPGVGVEPTRLSASVFETDVSAIPPPGRTDEV